jgi:hypothetical protein
VLAGLSKRQAERDEDMSYKPWDSWDSEYLTFEEDDHYEGKTKRLVIVSKRHLMILGEIKWHGPWRQYCFFPSPAHTVWNKGCLDDVQVVIKALMDERKVKR